REHILPTPLASSSLQLSLQRVWQEDLAQILLAQPPNPLQMGPQVRLECERHHGAAVFAPFALADRDLVARQGSLISTPIITRRQPTTTQFDNDSTAFPPWRASVTR